MTTAEEREHEKEALAEQASERINKGQHWQDWLYVADGLAVGRDKAMRAAGTNVPYGRQYAKAFSDWLEARPWAKRFDKKTRADALWVSDHLPQLYQWRESLAADVKLKLNHPTTVKRAFEATQRIKTGAPKPETEETWKQKAARLENELHQLKLRMERDGSLFDLKQDSLKDIARTIAGNVSLGRLKGLQKEIASEIRRLDTEQKHAG